MISTAEKIEPLPIPREESLCPVFGICGGCEHQHLPYFEELRLKEDWLRSLLSEKMGLAAACFDPIIASPKPYHYRTKLDLTLLRIKSGETFLGFQVRDGRRVISIDSCPISVEPISDILPTLKNEAIAKLPSNYRNANLVVRWGADGRVLWGGIGRRSLELEAKDYLWTEIHGKRIFYSLDTFFQANHEILPALMDKISEFAHFDPQTEFFDLYAGVGLFGIYFANQVGRSVLIEETPSSLALMHHNVAYHNLKNVECITARAEDVSPLLFEEPRKENLRRRIAMVDPPRRGLGSAMREMLTQARGLDSLIYLSCNPESLAQDLSALIRGGWKVIKVIPFDFFPKTRHLETLVFLKPC